jgi:predicted ATP-grasp superfamily ATP-dependent carboligase
MSAKGGAGDGVVVPAITHPSSLACERSLGRRGFRTILVSEDESAEAFRSRYCDESHVVPSPSRNAVAYTEALLDPARRPDVRTVLPVREKDVYVLSKYRGEFADHVGTPWPEFETLREVQDRIRLYDEGEAVDTFQHRQIRGVHYSGGASAFRQAVSIPELERLGTRLLDHLDWHGAAMVEFMRDSDTGDFELVAVNPRFWSSLPFTVQAGADFPYYAWSLANGECERIDCEYEVGAAGHLLSGETSHLLSILFVDTALVERPSFARTAADVASSLVRHPRFDYLDPTDPAPFARYAGDRLTGVAKRLVGSADEDDSASVSSKPPQRSRVEANESDFER